MSAKPPIICGRRMVKTPAGAVTPDWAPEQNLDRLAAEAQAIVTDVRQVDPDVVRRVLALACVLEPMRMAQILMVLGVWVPNDEPLSARGRRADAVAQGLPA